MENIKSKEFLVGEAKNKFSEVLNEVSNGVVVRIVKGKQRKLVAEIIPPTKKVDDDELGIGSLAHWGEFAISDDWEMTEEELLNL